MSLGRIGWQEHTRYLVTEESDGTLVFTPAVVLSELELKLLANDELVDEILSNRTDSSRLVKRTRRGQTNDA